MDIPLLFHIGMQRAGSTYLFSLLKGHPDVSLYPEKETHFYTQNFYRGIEWYRGCFPKDGIRIDTSPKYFLAGKQAAPRIKELLQGQKPRFLLILRNPIDYVYAHFRFHIKHGYFRWNEKYPKVYENLIDHVKAYPSYLRRGMYFNILQKYWLSNFDVSQFKIILFEDFISDTDEVIREIMSFFGLPYKQLSATTVGRGRNLRYKSLYQLREYIVNHDVTKRMLKLIKRSWLDYAYDRFLTEKPPSLAQGERAYLREVFAEDVKQLKELLGSNFPKWKDFSA